MTDEELQYKCALCGKSLRDLGRTTLVEETVDGTSYSFDRRDCAIMFKRFKGVYGDEFKEFLGQRQYISDPFWDKAIPKEEEIKEIEKEGLKPEIIDIVIRDPVQMQKTAFDMVKSATEEIMIIFSTSNAFHRQERQGAVKVLEEVEAPKEDVNIRILTPIDQQIKDTFPKLKEHFKKIEMRDIQECLHTKVTILVVDRRSSLAVELKDDNKDLVYEAMGLATYSTSKSTVLSYVSIFESLWKQVELNEQVTRLYEQLKIQDKMQQDFINVAAHELRAPIQPILGLAEVLRSRKKIDANEQEELLGVIIRNAKRLKGLTENILDVARIEGQSLTLHKEPLYIDDIILDVVEDMMNQIGKIDDLKLLYDSRPDTRLPVEADRGRITQVINNLLSNAVNFTKKGTVSIIKEKKNDSVVVAVKDTGIGIDSDMFPRLFTKFATKSPKGTGLGLYISKSIVEAHGGKIWAENNVGEAGATFTFSLPAGPS